MPNVVSTGVEGARQQSTKIKELQETTMTKTNEVTAALTKTNEIRKLMTEKMSALKTGMNEQLTQADMDKRNTVAMFEAKLSEATGKETHALEMQDAIKKQVSKLEEELVALKADSSQAKTNDREWLDRERKWHADEQHLRELASKATFELEASQRETQAASSVVERDTQRRLQELRDRHQKDMDRLKRESETELVALESKLKNNQDGASTAETSSLRNQLRDAMTSVDTLNQHVSGRYMPYAVRLLVAGGGDGGTELNICFFCCCLLYVECSMLWQVDLLTETLGVTKDLLSAKTQEVGECEYQWAAAKAKLAQCESDKMEHEADVVHVLEPIVSQIKRLVGVFLFVRGML
jgi:hypothetical protein